MVQIRLEWVKNMILVGSPRSRKKIGKRMFFLIMDISVNQSFYLVKLCQNFEPPKKTVSVNFWAGVNQ